MSRLGKFLGVSKWACIIYGTALKKVGANGGTGFDEPMDSG
jgi:hypothetical protein